MTVAGVALLYVVCAKLGLALSFRAAQVTAVWPPTGFALAAILLFGRRAAAGVLLGAFLANATASEPLWVAAGIAVGNTLEAWAGAMLLRRVRFDARLAHVRDVIVLLGALAVSPIVSATIGVVSLGAGGVQPMSALPELWWIWWLGDALGGLLVAPALLVWSHGEPMPRRRGAIIEGLLLLAGLLGASAFVFLRPAGVAAIEYIVFPFLIWAALRFGAAGTASATVVANAVAVWGTHLGRGPFAGAGPERGLVPLQLFMAVAATTGLLLGAAAAQSRREHQRKDEFLAMLSHELRNPLAPILHAIELLDERDDDVARDVIRRQAQHMSRLVDDLLDLARITRGEVQLERRPVTVAEVVNAAAGTWKHLVEQRRQKLSIWLPEESLLIDADPHRFTQIIANLLHNASKFTPEGGRISITAREESGSLVLRVRDNGAGMSPDVLAQAFEPFVQGAAGGLGLGLTLVRRSCTAARWKRRAIAEARRSRCACPQSPASERPNRSRRRCPSRRAAGACSSSKTTTTRG